MTWLGPAIAITRVACRPGAIPIQIESMRFLLAERLGYHHLGVGALRVGDHRARANFSATRVRFFLLPLAPPAVQPSRRLESAVEAPPVPLFRDLTRASALLLPAQGTAIH